MDRRFSELPEPCVPAEAGVGDPEPSTATGVVGVSETAVSVLASGSAAGAGLAVAAAAESVLVDDPEVVAVAVLAGALPDDAALPEEVSSAPGLAAAVEEEVVVLATGMEVDPVAGVLVAALSPVAAAAGAGAVGGGVMAGGAVAAAVAAAIAAVSVAVVAEGLLAEAAAAGAACPAGLPEDGLDPPAGLAADELDPPAELTADELDPAEALPVAPDAVVSLLAVAGVLDAAAPVDVAVGSVDNAGEPVDAVDAAESVPLAGGAAEELVAWSAGLGAGGAGAGGGGGGRIPSLSRMRTTAGGRSSGAVARLGTQRSSSTSTLRAMGPQRRKLPRLGVMPAVLPGCAAQNSLNTLPWSQEGLRVADPPEFSKGGRQTILALSIL
jgi:hypothetical protein